MLRRLLVVALPIWGMGCVHGYPQPALDAPHADVQIRVIHHAEIGPEFEEHVRVAGYDVRFSESSAGVRQTTLRVRPEAAEWTFQTEFFHSVTTWTTQTYWQSQSYMCGSSRFGPQYCSRSVPVTRTVPITTRVPDGGCGTSLVQTPLAGAVYLVQYEFVANGVCQSSCQRLLAGPGGGMLATDCGPGEPIPDAAVPPSVTLDTPMTAPPSPSEFPDETTSGGEIISPPATGPTGASQLGAPR